MADDIEQSIMKTNKYLLIDCLLKLPLSNGIETTRGKKI